jgi:hypothetical protein
VNPETSAFIAADGWFTLLTVTGGIISGLLGYALAVRRQGAPAMAGILVAGLAAALLAKWVGQQAGAAAFQHRMLVSQPGATLRQPLELGGVGPLAFWPLAAGLTAGGIELFLLLRERRAQRSLDYAPARPYGSAMPFAGSPPPPAPPLPEPDPPPAPGAPPAPSPPPAAQPDGSPGLPDSGD